MSIVAVKVTDKSICIAADSITIRSTDIDKSKNPSKLFKINDMIIGTVGHLQTQMLIEMYANHHTPKSSSPLDMSEYFADFKKWVKDKLFDHALASENTSIIIFKKKVFVMYGVAVIEVVDYAAIGYGENYARTAMHLGRSPLEAVQVACDLCIYCDTPIIDFEIDKTD